MYFEGWQIGAAVVALFVLVASGMVTYANSETDVTFTVTDKERVVTADDSYYLVFTEGEVFSNKDSITFKKFNSSDLQGQMRRGSECDAVVAGWRVPFFTLYRNVIEVDCA